MARISLAKCAELLTHAKVPLTPLEVLNCPSALCTYNTNPLKLLKEVAEPLASTYNIFIRTMAQGMQ